MLKSANLFGGFNYSLYLCIVNKKTYLKLKQRTAPVWGANKTMKKIIANAFSLQMLDLSNDVTIKITPIEKPSQEELQAMTSAVGHEDTAHVLGVKPNRINVSLDKDTELYVAQIVGGRLPEGSTKLPEGFSMKFLKVTLE